MLAPYPQQPLPEKDSISHPGRGGGPEFSPALPPMGSSPRLPWERIPRVGSRFEPMNRPLSRLLATTHIFRSVRANPKGIQSFSPGLRGTSYPGLVVAGFLNPERVAAMVLTVGARGCNPFRVGGLCGRLSQGRTARPLFPGDPTLG